jgi:hypothetical protein
LPAEQKEVPPTELTTVWLNEPLQRSFHGVSYSDRSKVYRFAVRAAGQGKSHDDANDTAFTQQAHPSHANRPNRAAVTLLLFRRFPHSLDEVFGFAKTSRWHEPVLFVADGNPLARQLQQMLSNGIISN